MIAAIIINSTSEWHNDDAIKNLSSYANKKISSINLMRFFMTTNFISRILFLHYHLSAINIAAYLMLPTLVCILAKRRRAALHQTYTWHYNTQGLPMQCIAAKHCERLPHIFTLASRRLFSVALSVVQRTPGSSPVGCSVLSGLSSLYNKAMARVCSFCKVICC